MAIAFNKTKGKAIKNTVESYEYKDGDNTVRIFGEVLPRYVYWLKGTNGKDIPVECLAFDRDLEKFTNVETDWVREVYGKDMKCSWAYSVKCLDPRDNKVKVLNLKKKLFEQILTAAEDLGDPTDPDTGWDIVFKRVKTGPLPFNVEYTLKALACKPRALSEDERALIAAAKGIDEEYPRPTAEDVKKTIDRIQAGASEEGEEAANTDKEAVNELNG